MEKQVLGRFVITDPDICHGKMTFRGTRILVRDVLDQVVQGMDWETIRESWRGAITDAAIAEAVAIARDALFAIPPRSELPEQ